MKSSITYWHTTLSIWIPVALLIALLSNVLSIRVFPTLLIASLLIYPLFTACLARRYLEGNREVLEAKMLVLINSVLGAILFYFSIILSDSDIGYFARNLSVDLHLFVLVGLFVYLWAYALRYTLLSRLSYSDFLPFVKKMRFPFFIALSWLLEGFLTHYTQLLIPTQLILHKRSVRFGRSGLHAQSLEISFGHIAAFAAVYLLIAWLNRVHDNQAALDHDQSDEALYKLSD